MIALRLVRLIETNADKLADSLVEKLGTSVQTSGLHGISRRDLRDRCVEIYGHLSDWLLHKSGSDIEERFAHVGELRARQNVPLADVIWGILLTKSHLWSFLEQQAFLQGPLELHGELEFLRLLDQFFDRAIYFLARGYEKGRALAAISRTESGKGRRSGDSILAAAAFEPPVQ